MGIRNYVNRKFSHEASQEEKIQVLEALRKLYSRVNDEKERTKTLGVLDDVEKVRLYPWMFNPPKIAVARMCCGFEYSADLRYDVKTKTLEIGGALQELLYLSGQK